MLWVVFNLAKYNDYGVKGDIIVKII